MFNIASYQEGYTDGHASGRVDFYRYVDDFISKNMEEHPDTEFLQGFNCALKALKEYIEEK